MGESRFFASDPRIGECPLTHYRDQQDLDAHQHETAGILCPLLHLTHIDCLPLEPLVNFCLDFSIGDHESWYE